MTPKRMIIILIALLIVGAAVVAYLMFFRPGAPLAATTAANAPAGGLPAAGGLGGAANSNAPTGAEGLPTITVAAPRRPTVSADELMLQTLKVAAIDFAERYGSYSTQGDFQNLETLLPAMTDKFAASTKDYIATNRAAPPAATFVGFTTKVLSVKPEQALAANTPVQALVQTQRVQTTATSTGVIYQSLRLTMIYDGNVWKADAAEWLNP